MVMESVDNDSVYEDSLLLFIDCLRKDAQANWKTSFLDSLKNQGTAIAAIYVNFVVRVIITGGCVREKVKFW